jgi:hypothetical protein
MRVVLGNAYRCRESGTEPRLLSLPASNRLPIGSSVLFNFPSCFFGKLNPYIEEIEPPTGTLGGAKSFWITLSHTVKNCKEPWDAAFPSDKYYITTYSYLVAPEGWDDYQPSTPEAQFVRTERVYSVDDLTGQNYLNLLNAEDNNCRVMISPFGNNIKITRILNDNSEIVVQEPNKILETIDTDINTWVSRINFQEVNMDDVKEIRVIYFAEAVETDINIINARGRCSYSKYNIDGYGDADGFICTNTACSKFQAGKYGGKTCWATDATGFNISFSQEADAKKANLSKFWTAEPLTLQQGATGNEAGTAASSHRNFSFNRESVPSIQSMVGGFFYQKLVAPQTRATESWFGPSVGHRVTFTDNDDRPWHKLAYGWYYSQDTNFPPVTFLPGWSARLNQRGVARTGVDARYPTHYGPSCSNVSFALSENPTPWIRLARPDSPEKIFSHEILNKEDTKESVQNLVQKRIP